MPSRSRRFTHVLLTAASGAALSAVAVSPSLAAPPAAPGSQSSNGASHSSAPQPGASCPAQSLSQPFAAWHDIQQYFLLPGADFLSQGAGWTLTGGTQVVTASASPTGYAAKIPSGGSLTTPAFCLSAGDPVLRTFALTLAKGRRARRASLKVAIVYASGKSKPVGRVPGRTSWRPTRKLSLAQGSALQGQSSAMVRYRFSATKGAGWELDNVYVDPRMRG